MLYLEHYQAALKVLEAPEFENQDLLLHDFNEEVYRSKPNYTDNGIHFGYVDALVNAINAIPAAMGYEYAIVVDGPYRSLGISEHHFTNSRFSKAKFSDIKEKALLNLNRKITEATLAQKAFEAKRKDPVEVTLPLSFEQDFFLAKFEDNWADEMDISGFAVLSQAELDTWKANIPETDYVFCIGTNEEISYATKEEFLKAVTVSPLPVEEAKLLYKLFGKTNTESLDWNGRYYNRKETSTVCRYGHFPRFKAV